MAFGWLVALFNCMQRADLNLTLRDVRLWLIVRVLLGFDMFFCCLGLDSKYFIDSTEYNNVFIPKENWNNAFQIIKIAIWLVNLTARELVTTNPAAAMHLCSFISFEAVPYLTYLKDCQVWVDAAEKLQTLEYVHTMRPLWFYLSRPQFCDKEFQTEYMQATYIQVLTNTNYTW